MRQRMAVRGDFYFLEHLIDRGMLGPRLLEIGSYNRQQVEFGNAQTTIEGRGLTWEGTDIDDGPGVDFTLDMLDGRAVRAIRQRWDGVLVMNLLEHVYDPIRVLEGALSLVAPGGQVVVVGPTVWQLHDFPGDYWRPMPDFFIEFARRHDCTIAPDGMRWIVFDRLLPVLDMRNGDQKLLPSLHTADQVFGPLHSRWSRAVHRLANTFGRSMFFPFVGLGVCLKVPDSARASE